MGSWSQRAGTGKVSAVPGDVPGDNADHRSSGATIIISTTGSTTPTTLRQDLDVLHSSYVSAINLAIEAGQDYYVDELAAAYDREATLMVARREGKTHLLPALLRRRRAAA